MILYGLTTCDTCRKARKALPEATFIDVRADGVPKDTMARAIAAFGDALINKRSTSWRALEDTARAMPAEALLTAHPTVMKRPLIDDGTRLFLGWNAETEAALSR